MVLGTDYDMGHPRSRVGGPLKRFLNLIIFVVTQNLNFNILRRMLTIVWLTLMKDLPSTGSMMDMG
jgi:hypothetical protein